MDEKNKIIPNKGNESRGRETVGVSSPKEKATEKKPIKASNAEKKGRISSLLRRKPKAAAEEKKAVAEAKPVEEKPIADPFDTLKFVLMTEKSIQLIETQNKLVFIVNKKSSKDDIKKAFENAFSTKVGEIKTMIDQKSRKKAFIKLKKEGEAGEIAIRLGII